MSDTSLPVPEEVVLPGGDSVLELARVWWNGEVPAMIIRPALRDPTLMGAVLAELAWNFSRAYDGSHGLDQAESLRQIKQGWQDAHSRAEGLKATPLMPSVSAVEAKEG